jgi:asparaginyl-tRNA synthetase
VTFDEAAELLGDDREFVVHDTALGWRGLTRAGERRLIELCGEFVWVTHFDELSVPFYQAVDGRGRAMNADLLFGPGEVVGAGQRHPDGASTLVALARHRVPAEEYAGTSP